MSYLYIFLTTFIYVALRAFQQKNVMHSKYGWMVPTSYGMAVCDVFIIASIARGDHNMVLTVLAMGTGGSMGSIFATYFHNRWSK